MCGKICLAASAAGGQRLVGWARSKVDDHFAILVLAIVSATGVTLIFARAEMHRTEIDFTLKPVAAFLDDDRKILESLSRDALAGPTMLDTYLKKIGRDGVAKYADDRHSIDSLNRNNLVTMARLSQYLPHTRNPQFKVTVEELTVYASSFCDRWQAVFEVFMAGAIYRR